MYLILLMYDSLNEELSHHIVVHGCPRQRLLCSDT